MTATAEHVITVTNLDDSTDRYRRPVAVTCSCGYSADTIALLGDALGQGYIARETRDTVARAWEIDDELNDKRALTIRQQSAIRYALICAADIADGIDPEESTRRAVDVLVKLVRGEA